MDEEKLLKIIEENNKMIKEYEQKLIWAYDEIKYLKEELALNKSREIHREAIKNSTIRVEVAENINDEQEQGVVLESESYVDSRVIETLILESSKANSEIKATRNLTQAYLEDESVGLSIGESSDEILKENHNEDEFNPVAIYEEGDFEVIEGIAIAIKKEEVVNDNSDTGGDNDESHIEMDIGEAISDIVVDADIGEAITHIIEDNTTNEQVKFESVAEYEDEGFEVEIGEAISEINLSEQVEANDEEEESVKNKEYNDAELLGELKNNFNNNNMYEVKVILDCIIDRINFIEENLNEDDLLVLIYLSYFTNKLNEILTCSSKVNNYYSKENLELHILEMIAEEKDYSLNTASKDCVYSIIKEKHDNIFVNFDIVLKSRIIEKVYSIAYKTFNEVSTVEKIGYGVKTRNIRAWVKQSNDFLWMLVDGLYSEEENELYMLESAIIILRLNKTIKSIQGEEEKNQPVVDTEVEISIDNEVVIENIVVEKKHKLGDKIKAIFNKKKI